MSQDLVKDEASTGSRGRFVGARLGKQPVMAATNVHVVPHGDEWAVEREGGARATSVHSTQADAIEAGRALAQRDEVELLVHAQDGSIRDRSTYGDDPHPPQG
jgi:hypothetical protein